MVTDGALKLNYASVIFVDPGVQIDETDLILLPQLLYAIHEVSGSLHLSTSMAQRMLVYSICVSQGSVATRFRCGGIF